MSGTIPFKKSKTDDLFFSTALGRPRSVPRVLGFPLVFMDGNNSTIIKQPGEYSSFVPWSPFQFSIESSGQVDLFGELRSKSGSIVAQATGEQIVATPGTSYDVNSDQLAVEIVDGSKTPVFQLFVSPPDEWRTELDLK